MSDSDQHVSKRRRIKEKVPFQPGFLRTIKVWNFTTYSYTEFVLSPTLNMIIGPNGSGKSTLVAAICLGLAGNINLIKRKNLKSMIKTGHDRAVIEITIENFEGSPPITIKRDFSAKDSLWTMNNRKCTETAVKELRAKLNIQLDNLCHFLPQERVAEFAGLSPEKLLMETERTLKDGHLKTLHEDLIDKDEKSQNLGVKVSELKQKLIQLHSDKEKLEEEARKLEEYERKAAEIENHRLLVPFAKFYDLRNQRTHLKEQRDQARARLQSFDKNFDPLRKDLSTLDIVLDKQFEKQSSINRERDTIKSKIQKLSAELTAKQGEIVKLLSQVEGYKNKAEQKKKELDLVKEEYELLKSQRESTEEIDNSQLEQLNDKYHEKRNESRQLEESLSGLNDKMSDLKSDLGELDHKVKRLEHSLHGTDKLELLQSSARNGRPYRLRDDSYRTHQKLRTSEQFDGHYFEAPVISCNVKDKSMAPAIEKVIDNNTLFAITVTNGDDSKMMNKFAKSININFPTREQKNTVLPRSDKGKDVLQNYGFEGYLSDYITGPNEVLCMLYNNTKLHQIPISRKPLSTDQINRIKSPPDGRIHFKKFIAGDTLFSVKQSNYGSRQISLVTEHVGRAQFFTVSGISEEEKLRLSNKINEYKSTMESKREEYQGHKSEANKLLNSRQELKIEMSAIKDHQLRLQEIIKTVTALDAKISSRKEKIDKLERESNKDYSSRIKQYEQKIAEEYNNYSTTSNELGELFVEYSTSQIESKFVDFETITIKNRKLSAETLVKELRSIENDLKEDYKKYKAEYDRIKDSAEYREFKEKNDSLSEEDKELLKDLATPFMEAGNFTEKTIRIKISHLEDELSLLSTADRGSIQSLRSKLQDIEKAETDLPRFENDKHNLDERIKTISTQWETELEEFIHQISLSFSKRFSKVASEGRVELAKSERFKDYKLQILVKFRQESELKILDNQSQSGGERAVSTIFYIMALQGLSDAPFRIVDEINQGMDPKNEQMAHRYLVHTACENNKSQYFLVTPKLLTGLYYHPDMVVHCIFTGPLIEENDDKSNTGFLDFVQKLVTV
ncbi:SMC5 [Candida jiufengensis]|uniref:SMC5 n=1 Tax=Candida jiufengensis TaxID=497108 RepID=UPI00222482AF|nr:SMC5 [Candida jiufengensis]KAI5951148.1 SMC5 [Candida jiufengensis]